MKNSYFALLCCGIIFAISPVITLAEPPSEPVENTLGQHLPPDVTVRSDLAYVTGGDERQQLDLYLPNKTSAMRPLVVFVHGGGWVVGSKVDCPQSLGDLLKRGYVVASISYRLSQHAHYPAQIEDCKAAIRWLRAHATEYNLDPGHVAVIGPSAGGHLVALLGTTGQTREFDVGENLKFPSEVQAVIDYYGPTDLALMPVHARTGSDSAKSPEDRLIGGPIGAPENRAAVQRASPLTFLTSATPPFLIIHGDADPVVPHHQSELLYAMLVSAHVPVRWITVRGGGHGDRFPVALLTPIVGEFLDHHLKGILPRPKWPVAMQSDLPAVSESSGP